MHRGAAILVNKKDEYIKEKESVYLPGCSSYTLLSLMLKQPKNTQKLR